MVAAVCIVVNMLHAELMHSCFNKLSDFVSRKTFTEITCMLYFKDSYNLLMLTLNNIGKAPANYQLLRKYCVLCVERKKYKFYVCM